MPLFFSSPWMPEILYSLLNVAQLNEGRNMICGPRPTIASVEGIPYNEKREVFLIPGLDPGGAANQDDPKDHYLG